MRNRKPNTGYDAGSRNLCVLFDHARMPAPVRDCSVPLSFSFSWMQITEAAFTLVPHQRAPLRVGVLTVICGSQCGRQSHKEVKG